MPQHTQRPRAAGAARQGELDIHGTAAGAQIAGSAVGAGLLALPAVTFEAGFVPSTAGLCCVHARAAPTPSTDISPIRSALGFVFNGGGSQKGVPSQPGSAQHSPAQAPEQPRAPSRRARPPCLQVSAYMAVSGMLLVEAAAHDTPNPNIMWVASPSHNYTHQ